MRGFRSGVRTVLVAAWTLICAQLVLRAWVVHDRHLYLDDLRYGTEAVLQGLFSTDYLVEGRDGHFMPAALLLHGTLYRLFPLQWAPFWVALVVLQLVASVAVLRLLRVLLGDRPVLLVPLAVYLFSPLTLGSFTWWAAAMNALPLQIGLAWFVADAVLLARTRRRRHALTGTLALIATLLFNERAALIPFLAFVVVAVLLHAEGIPAPLRAAWSRGRALWLGTVLALAAWAAVYLTVVDSTSEETATLAEVVEMTRLSATHLVPALLGGPWRWFSVTGPPLADPPPWTDPVSAVLLAALVVWSVIRWRGAVVVWVAAAGYALAGAVLVAVARASGDLAGILPLTYRHVAAEAVVAALVLALLVRLPLRRPPGPAARSSGEAVRAVAAALATLLVVAGSVYTTIGHQRAWAPEHTGDYLRTARGALADAGAAPLLDWSVPESVVPQQFAPLNRASALFAPLPDRPPFARWTSDLRQLDEAGELSPAQVDPGVGLAAGPDPGCGWAVDDGAGTSVQLAGAVPAQEWTAALDYVADRDGTIVVALGSGEPVRAEVAAGTHTVYLRLVGGGSALQVTGATPEQRLCLGSGVVGTVALR